MRRKSVLLVASLAVAVGLVSFAVREDIAGIVWSLAKNDVTARMLLESGTSDPRELVAVGDYFFNGGTYDLPRASAAYERALALAPHMPGIHHQLSRIHFVQGGYDRALEESNLELAAHPEDTHALYMRGLIYGFTHHFQESERDFRAVVEKDPNVWAYNDLLWVLSSQGKFAEAVRFGEAALRILPDAAENPWLQNSIGVAHLNLRAYADASRVLERAERLGRALSLEDFARAYPGNNPNELRRGMDAFRAALAENARRSRVGDTDGAVARFPYDIERNSTTPTQWIAQIGNGFIVPACGYTEGYYYGEGGYEGAYEAYYYAQGSYYAQGYYYSQPAYAPPPDLVIANLVIPHGNPGQAVVARVLIQNLGGLSTGVGFDINVQLPLVHGLYTAIAMIDSSCAVGESIETNNKKLDQYVVNGPNLIITAFDIPDGISAQLVVAKVTIKNVGIADAAPGFWNALHRTLPITSCFTPKEYTKFTSPIAVNASRTINIPIFLPTTAVVTTYTAGAMVDATCVVVESLGSDNFAADTYTVRPSGPNLVVTAFSVPDGVVGAAVNAAVTIENRGDASTGADFEIGVRRNASTMDCTSSKSGSVRSGTVLAPGGSITMQVPITLPGVAGTYTAISMADSWSPVCEIAESDEGDNTLTTTYTVSSSGPNLVITSFSIPTGVINTSVNATVVIKNTGDQNTLPGPFKIAINMDSGVMNCGTPEDAFVTDVGSIVALTSRSYTIPVTLPAIAGVYTGIAMVDADCQVAESDNSDNTLTDLYRANNAGPNLVVTLLDIPDGTISAPVTARVRVQNTGDTDAGTFDVGVHVNALTLACGSPVSGTVTINGGLLAGATSPIKFVTVTLPPSPGIYTAVAMADIGCVVAESREGDNRRTTTYNAFAVGPNLIVEDFDMPDGIANTSVLASVTIRNNGSVDTPVGVSFEVAIRRNVVLVTMDCATPENATQQTPQLQAGDFRTLTLSVVLPNNPGTYTAVAMADSDCGIGETDEFDNWRSDTYTVVAAGPNLVINSFTVPNGVINVVRNAQVVYENVGNASAASSFDLAIIMNGVTMDCVTVEDAAQPQLPVGVNVPQTRNIPVTLPSIPGVYTASAMIDADCEIGESNEFDNVATANYVVSPAGPNLIVSIFTIPNGVTLASVSVTGRVTNIGNAPAGATVLGINFTSPVINCGGPQDAQIAIPGMAGGGAFRNFSIVRTHPATAGTYTGVAMADATCLIAESDENNNKRTDVYVVTESGVNLNVSAFNIPNGSISQVVPASIQIRNTGDQGTGIGFESAINMSRATMGCGTTEHYIQNTGPLGAGGTRNLPLILVTLPAIPGTYTGVAMVDSDCAVPELDASDNDRPDTYLVTNLFLFTISAPDITIRRGQSGSINVTVTQTNGIPEDIQLSVVSPPGVTMVFSDTLAPLTNVTTACLPVCVKQLVITVGLLAVPVGPPIPVTIDGVSLTSNANDIFNLRIQHALLRVVDCTSQDPNPAVPNPKLNTGILWSASIAGGNPPYDYEWRGTDGLVCPISGTCLNNGATTHIFSHTYPFPPVLSGLKLGEVRVSSSDGQITPWAGLPATCAGCTVIPTCQVTVSMPILSFSANPNLINPGEISVLSWRTVGMDNCRLDDDQGIINNLPVNANCNPPACPNTQDQVLPAITTVYTLTCRDIITGDTDSKSDTVGVRAIPDVIEDKPL